MPQTLIQNFFFPSNLILSNEQGSVLSKPCTPASQHYVNFQEVALEAIKCLEISNPVYIGTITFDPKKYGFLDRKAQELVLTKAMWKFIRTQPKSIYIWAIEYHEDFRPHIHLLSTNYIKNFKDSTKHLGARNTHKSAYQKTINIVDVYNYIIKTCPRAVKMNIIKEFNLYYHETHYNSTEAPAIKKLIEENA